jgi:hypothetical protein
LPAPNQEVRIHARFISRARPRGLITIHRAQQQDIRSVAWRLNGPYPSSNPTQWRET